jgi:hypothetical protein
MLKENKYQYRVEDSQVIFNDDVPYHFNKMRVISETEKSYLLYVSWDFKGKRMYKNSNNRYAFDTKEEALKSYLKRKEYQKKCLIDRLMRVDIILKYLKESEVKNG